MRRITARDDETLATTTTAAGEAARKPIHETGQNAHVSFVCSMADFSAQMRLASSGNQFVQQR
jgi:hypothetical protein